MARNAIGCFERGEIEDGLIWLRGFVEHLRDSRTAEMLASVERRDFGKVARLLSAYL